MAAFTRAASRTRVEFCRGVNGVSSASTKLTLDRALAGGLLINPILYPQVTLGGRVSGVSRETVAQCLVGRASQRYCAMS